MLIEIVLILKNLLLLIVKIVIWSLQILNLA